MKKIIMGLLIVMGMTGSPITLSHAAAQTAPQTAPKSQNVTVKVKGLFCDLCRVKMQKSFKKNKSVQSVSVNLDSGIVQLKLKVGGSISDAAIKKIVTDTGYTTVSIKRS